MTMMEPRGSDPKGRARATTDAPAASPYVQAMDGVRLTHEQKEDLVNSILTRYAAESAGGPAVALGPGAAVAGGSASGRRAAAAGNAASASTAASAAPRITRRQLVTLLSAAALGAGAVGAAFAASQAQVSVSDILETFFGGSSGSGPSGTGGGAAGGAEGAGVGFGTSVGASATSDGVTVTVDSVVGDASNAAIVVTVQREDGSDLGVSRNPETGEPDFWLAGGSDSDGTYTPTLSIDDVATATTGILCYDADASDNAVQVMFAVAVDDGVSLIGKTAHLHIPDLRDAGASESHRSSEDASAEEQTWHDDFGPDSFPVVAQGPWDIDFTLDYEDSSCVYEAADTVVSYESLDATLTSVRVSPIALSLDFSVVVHADMAESHLQQMGWEGEFMNLPVTLVMDDGEEYAPEDDKASNGLKLGGSAGMEFSYPGGYDPADPQGDFEGTSSRSVYFGRVIDPASVVAVAIAGTRVDLSPAE